MAAAIFGKDGFRRKDSSCSPAVVKPQPQPKHLSNLTWSDGAQMAAISRQLMHGIHSTTPPRGAAPPRREEDAPAAGNRSIRVDQWLRWRRRTGGGAGALVLRARAGDVARMIIL